MSSSSSVTSTSTSLGTQIDVTTLVSQLMSAEQQPIINLQNQQANSQALISAYGAVQSGLSTFQSAMSGLTDVTQFQGMTVNSSNSSAVAGTATSSAAPGSYSVSVSSLAQAQTLVAPGVVSQTAAIGAGGATTLTFNFGTINGNTLNSSTGKYGTTLSAATTNGSSTVTVASTANLAVGAAISGAGIPAGATIASITDANNFVISTPATASGTAVSLQTGATFSASTTSGSTTVSGSTANLAVGAAITGAGIPSGATIASITDANNFVISSAATATGTSVALEAGATFTPNGNGAKTVTINSSNNSLQGIASAINAANIGVTATIINDGSSAPYRLTLTSKSSGVSNSMQISVAGDAALSSLLTEDPSNGSGQNLTQTATAQNANFTVNGIAVSKPSNTVTDVVSGLTLNLQQTSTTPVNLTIAQNTSTTSAAVSTFVKAYNALHTVINNVTAYNASTKSGAILMGDFAVGTLNSQLHEMLNTPIKGAGALSSLSDVGVTFQTDGTLAVDQTKLNKALSSNFNDVAALFDTVGQATDPQISYTSAGSTAKAGNYDVNISQLATQGSLAGSSAAGLTITSGTNDSLSVTIDGTSAVITLTPGTYTASTLATEVQNAINGSSTFSAAGTAVTVTQNNGTLTVTSNKYGSTSNVSISGNGASNLLGSAPVSSAGVDVAGSIAGTTATGSGQSLTASAGDALGLKILVSGGALGDRGTVDYSQGFAGMLNLWATSQTGTSGLLSAAVAGQNSTVKLLGTQITAQQTRLSLLQASYTKQYTALDLSLASMASTSTYLSQQLTALVKSN
jgi:flagellar hook-associated protein 2